MIRSCLSILGLSCACAIAQGQAPAPPPAPRELRQFKADYLDNIRSFAFAPDGKRAACGTFRTIYLWDLATGKELARHQTRGAAHVLEGVHCLAFSRDGTRLLAACGDSTVRVFATADLKVVGRFDGHTGPVYAAGFLGDGSEAYSAGADGVIRLWKVATGRQHTALRGHTGEIGALALAPDETYLLSAGGRESVQLAGISVAFRFEDCEPRLWEVKTRKEVRRCAGPAATVLGLAYSPDGKRFACCGKDRTVRVFDAASGQELARLGGDLNFVVPFRRVSFSSDGRYLLADDQYGVRLLRADTLVVLGRCEVRFSFGASSALAPDGRRFFTSSGDTATLWEWSPALFKLSE